MTDILQYVRSELKARKGEIRRIAKETGVSYDTCLRIRDEEVDPGYSKVRQLADHLRKIAKVVA